MRTLDRLVRHRTVAVLVVLAIALSACSSTNLQTPSENAAGNGAQAFDPSSGVTGSGEPQAGSPLPGATAGGATAGATAPGAGASGSESGGQAAGQGGGAVAPGGGSGGGGSGGAASGGGGGGTTGSGGGPVAGGPTGPGVSADQINIGISLFKAGDYGSAIGVGGIDFGNTNAQAQAVVDYVNANGGIAGRKVNPIYYTLDFGRPGLADGQSEQEACAKWTEDNKVFAVVNNVMARHALLVCLAKRDVLGVHDGMPIDEGLLAQYRNYYYSGMSGAGLLLDRQAFATADGLGQQGYFKDAVVGIQHFDDPAYKRVVEEVYIPTLRRHGAQKFVLQAAPRGGADGAVAYASRFRREGVTHVLFLGEGGLYPLFFMRGAESQMYRPKYALNTDQQIVVLQSGAPPEQLRNARGVGWAPYLDVANEHDPGPVSPAHTLCFEIMRAAGQNMADRGAQGTALAYCSGLFFLRQVINAAPSISSAGFAQVVAGLGKGYVSPGTFETFYSQARHDGVNAYREFAFPDGQSRYTSEVRRLS